MSLGKPPKAVVVVVTVFFLFILTYVNLLGFLYEHAMTLWPNIGLRHDAEILNKIIIPLDENEVVGKTIFFLETSSLRGLQGYSLKRRQACAIESAARIYGNSNIYVFFLRSPDQKNTYLNNPSAMMINLISNITNLRLRSINFKDFIKNTPLQKLDDQNALNGSLFPINHASDMLRYAALFKFNGTYLDLDVITIKYLALSNYAALQSEGELAAGVIDFAEDQVGREIAKDCAEEISEHFDGSLWDYNSVGVLSRVLNRRCRYVLQNNIGLHAGVCGGFHVLSKETFYEIHYSEHKLFFNKDIAKIFRNRVKKSFGLHIWNALNENEKLPQNDLSIPYLFIAKENCPKVYEAVEGDFNEV